MSEVEGTRTSISRREVIQRGAVVGGMVWAAPAFSVLGPRAFAQTNGSPFPGDVSWVMVWFVDPVTKTLYRVKYESTASGYSAQPGVTEQQMSSNDSNRFIYYKKQEDNLPDGLDFSTALPPDISAWSTSAGSLRISVGGSIKVYGWILHDGSCQTNGTSFLRAGWGYEGSPAVGPTGLPVTNGEFDWVKCS
jgi:hypothetical protein